MFCRNRIIINESIKPDALLVVAGYNGQSHDEPEHDMEIQAIQIFIKYSCVGNGETSDPGMEILLSREYKPRFSIPTHFIFWMINANLGHKYTGFIRLSNLVSFNN